MSSGLEVVPRERLLTHAADVVLMDRAPLQLLVEEFSRWVLSRGSFGFSKEVSWSMVVRFSCHWLRSVTCAFAVLGSFVVCPCWHIWRV